jgi:hypothetical protein
MNDIKHLAKYKYNFTDDEFLVYSSVNIFFEQMEELTPTFLTLILLNFECVILVSFFLLFDLKTIFLLAILICSTLVSIAASIFLFDFSLSLIVLVHFVMIPAFVCEFFYSATYLYLYSFKFSQENSKNQLSSNDIQVKLTADSTASCSTSKKTEADDTKDMGTDELVANIVTITPTNSCEDSSLSNSNQFNKNKKFKLRFLRLENGRDASFESQQRLTHLKYSYQKTIKHSALYLFYLFLNFFLLLLCRTYSFRALCLMLMSCSFNLLLHLFLFFPAIFSLFGTFYFKMPKL